ncbi:alpha/beta hydrolase [Vibrio sp. FJH11]
MAEGKHTILLVHGMGTHKKEEMKKNFISCFNETVPLFGIEKLKNFDISKQSGFVIEEFNYSDDFDEHREKLSEAQDKDQIAELLVKGPKWANIMANIIHEATDLNKDGFFYTHWLDVIIYCLTPKGVETSEKLACVLERLNRKSNRVTIIAHSLGAAVAHDALDKMYGQFGHKGLEAVDNFITFANVGRLTSLLSGRVSPVKSHVHNQSNGAIGSTHLNIYNELDPFTLPFPFRSHQKGDVYNQRQGIQKSTNPHDFCQYVAHPKFVRWFMTNLFTSLPLIYDRQYEDAKDKYRVGSINDKFDNVRQMVEELEIDDQTPEKVEEIIKSIEEIYRLIEETVKALKEAGEAS